MTVPRSMTQARVERRVSQRFVELSRTCVSFSSPVTVVRVRRLLSLLTAPRPT